VEGALAIAQAALDAREFAVARAALEPLAAAPTQRVALLFSRLEELEHGDTGRAREWMTRAVRARRDPVWTADGFVSDHWLPVSPVTGRLDAFVWTEPVAQIGGSPGAVIDAGEEAAAPTQAVAPPIAAAPPVPEPIVVQPAPAAQETPRLDVNAGTVPASEAPPIAVNAEKVIPLLHAPDDPGPDGEPHHQEPVPDIKPPGNLDWLRGLFK
jgi:HemY protein